MKIIAASFVVCMIGCLSSLDKQGPAAAPQQQDASMQLGNFTLSLTVKDLAASREFYEKLGFKVDRDMTKQGWIVLQNDSVRIGLFQGMFEKNMLTFNPGRDRELKTPPKFDDVRDIQKALKAKGIKFKTEADESSTGPASFEIVDPDGNPILVDQFVPRPTK